MTDDVLKQTKEGHRIHLFIGVMITLNLLSMLTTGLGFYGLIRSKRLVVFLFSLALAIFALFNIVGLNMNNMADKKNLKQIIQDGFKTKFLDADGKARQHHYDTWEKLKPIQEHFECCGALSWSEFGDNSTAVFQQKCMKVKKSSLDIADCASLVYQSLDADALIMFLGISVFLQILITIQTLYVAVFMPIVKI
jgi:hypothetical protein